MTGPLLRRSKPRCREVLDFDSHLGRYRWGCSLPRGHVGAHEAWTNDTVTDNPVEDRHVQWATYEDRHG